MSGFAGMIALDGAPISRRILEHLTDCQSFRGPDAKEMWISGHVGFGHALLKTAQSTLERQPCSIDGLTWIVGDCRVDARSTLIEQLGRSEHDLSKANDAKLILYAYRKWSDNCVDHLLGDFAFAIWDGGRKRLFCARDQMGVKPFYYSRIGTLLIFSNTLNCIRQHPAVSDKLNDLAIADFLLFDLIREPGATSFADIHRLPAAHVLVGDKAAFAVRRYWSLPVSSPIHYKRSNEYLDEFRELLHTAVADRLRTDRAGVLMSGGLDSSTVAASAQRILTSKGADDGLCAYTEVFDTLIPHEERHYATLVAEALKISIKFQGCDNFGLWKYLHQAEIRFPEPLHSPWSDWGFSQLRQVAETRRVALTGYGGDPALSCLLTVHFLDLLKKMQLGRALADALRYLASEGRASRLYLHTRFRRWFASKKSLPLYPDWLNRQFEQRLGLRERWHSIATGFPNASVRPVAYESLVHPLWASIFERCDSGVTRATVDVRHPFFDLRLIKFLLALPALPWCSDKELLRHAARGILPDCVRLRRKSPLLADPLLALLKSPESTWVDSFIPSPELNQYVQRDRIPKLFGEKDAWNAWIGLRPLSLSLWLRSRERSRIKIWGVAS